MKSIFTHWKTTSTGILMIAGAAWTIYEKRATLDQATFTACIGAILTGLGFIFASDGSQTPPPANPSAGGSNAGGSLGLLLAIVIPASLLCAGCKSPHLEAGGAYAPAIISTNADGTVNIQAIEAPDLALFVADTAYKLAYDAVDGVLLYEYNNRAELQQKIPSLKPALDKIRPQVWNIEKRWAKARAAYLSNPIPANLGTLQTILGEIQKLVPAVQASLAAY